MIRRPPRSTLFPYTSSSDLLLMTEVAFFPAVLLAAWRIGRTLERSEEHTSELQSQFHLVCRLLLEKKNRSERNAREERDREHVHRGTPEAESAEDDQFGVD